MSTKRAMRYGAVVGVAMLAVVTLFGSTGAQASPPQSVGLRAGPGIQYPKVGYYDSYQAVRVQCWAEDASHNNWVRITYNGVTGFAADTPFSSVHRTSVTPPCSPLQSCDGHANHIVQLEVPGQNPAFYVTPEGCQLRWIPDAATYWCLVGQGVKDDGSQWLFVVTHMWYWGPDMTCEA